MPRAEVLRWLQTSNVSFASYLKVYSPRCCQGPIGPPYRLTKERRHPAGWPFQAPLAAVRCGREPLK